MKNLIESPPQSSPEVVSEIVTLHNSIIGAARMTIEKAIRIGELLTEIKTSLAHGQWLPWVKANLPFDERTARRYMAVFDNREKWKTDTMSDLTDAYRLLACPCELQVEKFTGYDDAYDFIVNLPDAETLAGDLSAIGCEKFETIHTQTISILDRCNEELKQAQTAGHCLKLMRIGKRLQRYWEEVILRSECFMGEALIEMEAAKTGRTP